ncbi:MAG: hypothetical protein R2711_01520 [Acidimicrobiales bacterium]
MAGLLRRLWRGEAIFGHEGPAGSWPVLHLDSTFDEDIPLLLVAFGPQSWRSPDGPSTPLVLHTFFTDETTARAVATVRRAAEEAGSDPKPRCASGRASPPSRARLDDDVVAKRTVGWLATYLQGYGDLLVRTNGWDPDALAPAGRRPLRHLPRRHRRATRQRIERLGTIIAAWHDGRHQVRRRPAMAAAPVRPRRRRNNPPGSAPAELAASGAVRRRRTYAPLRRCSTPTGEAVGPDPSPARTVGERLVELARQLPGREALGGPGSASPSTSARWRAARWSSRAAYRPASASGARRRGRPHLARCWSTGRRAPDRRSRGPRERGGRGRRCRPRRAPSAASVARPPPPPPPHAVVADTPTTATKRPPTPAHPSDPVRHLDLWVQFGGARHPR